MGLFSRFRKKDRFPSPQPVSEWHSSTTSSYPAATVSTITTNTTNTTYFSSQSSPPLKSASYTSYMVPEPVISYPSPSFLGTYSPQPSYSSSNNDNNNYSYSYTLLPGPTSPPRCLECNSMTKLYRGSANNRNGNGRRPYYKCDCGHWASFGDNIGNYPWNPLCDCRLTSRRQKYNDRDEYFYRCRLDTCRFWSEESGEEAREQKMRLGR